MSQAKKPDEAFEPNKDILATLLSMGYSRELATEALMFTGNSSADLAVQWILDSQERDFADSDSDAVDLDPSDFYKMVLVVNSSLAMGPGKMAAQVAHAALSVYKILLESQDRYGSILLNWEEYGETKVVLNGTNAAQLDELAMQAERLGLVQYIVEDAGRTQVPEGSRTVLGIIGKINQVDQVTGMLPLL